MNRIRSSISALLGRRRNGTRGTGGLSSPSDIKSRLRPVRIGEPPVPREHSNLTSSCLSCPSFLFSSALWPCSSAPHPEKFPYRPYLRSGYQKRRKAG